MILNCVHLLFGTDLAKSFLSDFHQYREMDTTSFELWGEYEKISPISFSHILFYNIDKILSQLIPKR